MTLKIAILYSYLPTPVKNSNRPDLKYIKNAFKLISKNLKKDDIPRSTVYPNTTEVFVKISYLKIRI